MCGWEKPLLRLSLVEAGINLVLSFALVRPMGLLGVAVGTLVPTVLIGWLGVIPLTTRFFGMGLRELIRQVVQPVLAPVAASVGALAALMLLVPLPADARFLECSWRGAVVCLVTLIFAAPYLRNLMRKAPLARAAQPAL